MTTFKRNSATLMKRIRKTGRPVILTVNGKAEAVVLDAAAYRDVAVHLDSVARIRNGLSQAKKGLGRSVDEVFDDLD
jgi:prevent-host-death family protein